MRLLKKWDKINRNPRTEKIEPYRSFPLTADEIEKYRALPCSDEGQILSSKQSEELLKEILDARQMGTLLYPELERDDWSGFTYLDSSGTFYMY